MPREDHLFLHPFRREGISNHKNRYCIEQRDNIQVIGDCSIDLVFTDPPYNLSSRSKLTKVGRQVVEADFDGEDDWDTLPEAFYRQRLEAWVQEWARVVRPGGAVISFIDRAQVSYLWDLCRKQGLRPKNVLVWVKQNPNPAGLVRRNLLSATEFLVWAVKPGARYTFNRVEGWNRHNALHTTVISHREKVSHPTQKPLAVLLPLIQLTTHPGDLILDPFAGSGSIGVAAHRLGRQCHLIERNPAYVALAEQRLKKETHSRLPESCALPS